MPNQKVAERIYEEHGEVGFWYFYKDSVLSHLNTVWTSKELLEIEGIKMIAYGIFHIFAAVLQLVLMITAPIWIPLKNFSKARKASKQYKQWMERTDK